MSRYIDAEYVKAVMINDRLMQGNAEINLYMQQVETQVKAMPSIDIVRCKECKWAKANGAYQWCGRLDSTARIIADDYCSYGDRKDKCKECWYWSEVYKRCENKCGCQFKPYEERKESE